MALNYIWTGFFLVGFIAALFQWMFLGDTEIFKRIIDGTFDSAKMAVMDIALPLAGVMTFWLGIMNVGEKAGAIRVFAHVIGPFFARIFPGVPRDHPANGHMVMNFSANMLGLDNAATPFGLKAMESLQSLNPKKDEATDAQLMFLVIQTSGLTIIPLAVMAQRAVLGAANPADIFIPTLIATYTATIASIIAVGLRQRINLLDPVVFGWIGGTAALIASIVFSFTYFLDKAQIQLVSNVIANLVLFSVIAAFMTGALIKKVNVFENFIEGAKAGVETSIKIIPYLVGMIVAISVVRNSGVLGLIVSGFAWVFNALGLQTDFVGALPTALMKSLSGSGARAMMIDAIKTYGVDSFVGRLSSILQGASDTTFYIIALYFGSVGIRKTRYAVSYGLLADLIGIIAAVFVAYLFFG
ncbi:nucleoside recognition domain-containing protein [Massilia sp. DD77]|uniref:nucleoside recognition domain-containing protein n=1 Tax=Massilia sp. DD77 TaxID=3109349 RepID=UPI003000A35E